MTQLKFSPERAEAAAKPAKTPSTPPALHRFPWGLGPVDEMHPEAAVIEALVKNFEEVIVIAHTAEQDAVVVDVGSQSRVINLNSLAL